MPLVVFKTEIFLLWWSWMIRVNDVGLKILLLALKCWWSSTDLLTSRVASSEIRLLPCKTGKSACCALLAIPCLRGSVFTENEPQEAAKKCVSENVMHYPTFCVHLHSCENTEGCNSPSFCRSVFWVYLHNILTSLQCRGDANVHA